MHNLKKMIWKELETTAKNIEMEESKKMESNPNRSMYHENVIMLKDLAEAYVYIHKACKIHEEHMESMKDEESENPKKKMFD